MHTVAVCYNCSRAVCGVPAPYVVRRRRSGPLKSAPPAQKCAVFCAVPAHSAPPHHIGVGTPHSGCPFLHDAVDGRACQYPDECEIGLAVGG